MWLFVCITSAHMLPSNEITTTTDKNSHLWLFVYIDSSTQSVPVTKYDNYEDADTDFKKHDKTKEVVFDVMDDGVTLRPLESAENMDLEDWTELVKAA